ncbi:MAG: hypothetical protein COA58_16690 [Bacteroidetes bacterium]|nr:MAG: hypothetical protein COA58_16690 [Bacteroidota bacterium]
MSRDNIHNRIDELLGLISIHNSRLSLHSEKLSQLDIDVLRKQCIDLYDQVNMLALQGKIKAKVSSEPEPTSIPKEQVEIPKEVTPPKPVVAIPISEPRRGVSSPEPIISEKPKNKPVPKPLVEEEMLSLFEKFSSKPISSIPKSISVAKRFEFQSGFFDGEAKDYNQFMKSLDAAGNRESAFEIYHEYKNRLEWGNEDLKDELKALMYRRYTM